MTFLYFAHGSNLKLSEMQRKFKALLNGHPLVFPRQSTGRQCGVSNVEPLEGGKVLGDIYSISETERIKLERREGYRQGRAITANSYIPQNVTVFEGEAPDRPLLLLTFVANAQGNPPLPCSDYKGLIILGAREWDLDSQYISSLEEVETLK